MPTVVAQAVLLCAKAEAARSNQRRFCRWPDSETSRSVLSISPVVSARTAGAPLALAEEEETTTVRAPCQHAMHHIDHGCCSNGALTFDKPNPFSDLRC